MDRATPYHRPHSTQVSGYAFIRGGDDRYTGNIFFGGTLTEAYGQGGDGKALPTYGLAGYDEHPASFDEYLTRIDAQGPGDHQRFLDVLQPVYATSNVYAAGARPFAGEPDPHVLGDATVKVVEEGDEVYVETTLPAGFDEARVGVVSGRDLPRVRFADADFEEPDGTPAVIDVDLTGARRTAEAAPGPIAALTSGTTRLRVW
jgi:hypothetical protein